MTELGGIHPCDSLSVGVGIYQSIFAQFQFGVAVDNVVDHLLHEVAILFGGLLEA